MVQLSNGTRPVSKAGSVSALLERVEPPHRARSLRFGYVTPCGADICIPSHSRTRVIIRIFRVQVPREEHAEFEQKFRSVSLPLVQAQPGLVSVVIARPLPCAPDEFTMITTWQDLDSLRAFAGPDYTAAVIPHGMEQHCIQTWVHHYEVIS